MKKCTQAAGKNSREALLSRSVVDVASRLAQRYDRGNKRI